MGYIETFIPGQISLPNYTYTVTPPAENEVAWFPGQITKIEGYQYNESLVANHPHMPNPYQPNNAAHADTIWGELDRLQWLRAILLEVEWGKTETSPGVFLWTFLDFVFNTVRGLTRPTGQNKKVWLLINLRHVAQLTGLEDFLPADLLTQPETNSGYYKNPTTFPPAQINPIVNAKKYDNVWCYEASNPNEPGGPVEPRGYNFNCYMFRPGAGASTLKTRYQAFLSAVASRYGDDPVFGGIITTEAATGSPFVAYETNNSRNNHYAGRKEIVKYIKSLLPNRIVAECVNFDETYYQDMTKAGATDGLIANKLAFTTANFHTGKNMKLGNINTVMKGQVPIIMQAQGLDMGSKSGNQSQYYNWPTAPTQLLSGDGINWNDPPNGQWLFDRFIYFGTTHGLVQRNYDNSRNANQFNWPKWKTYMNNSIYANDEFGGMLSTKPQVVG
ncbi:MAG: hypothetical protein DYH15_13020 [Nitrosomonas sp. PRO4]|nr:hypothetical protein [Nitrosomonas sp. PRO4]